MAFLDDLCRDFISKRFVLFPHEKTPRYWADSHSQLELAYSQDNNTETLAITEKDRSECKWLVLRDEKTVRVNIAAEKLPEYLTGCKASEDYLSHQVAERFNQRAEEVHPTGYFVSETFNDFTYQDAVEFLDDFYPPRV